MKIWDDRGTFRQNCVVNVNDHIPELLNYIDKKHKNGSNLDAKYMQCVTKVREAIKQNIDIVAQILTRSECVQYAIFVDEYERGRFVSRHLPDPLNSTFVLGSSTLGGFNRISSGGAFRQSDSKLLMHSRLSRPIDCVLHVDELIKEDVHAFDSVKSGKSLDRCIAFVNALQPPAWGKTWEEEYRQRALSLRSRSDVTAETPDELCSGLVDAWDLNVSANEGSGIVTLVDRRTSIEVGRLMYERRSASLFTTSVGIRIGIPILQGSYETIHQALQEYAFLSPE